MLTVQDSRIVTITLEGLENILKVGQKDASNGGVNPYSILIEEAYGEDCSFKALGCGSRSKISL